MKLQVSRSHMQVLEAAAGDNDLCSAPVRTPVGKLNFSSLTGHRRKSLERGKRDMVNVPEALNFKTRHHWSLQVHRMEQAHLV